MNHYSYTDFLEGFGATLKPALAYDPSQPIRTWQKKFRKALGSLAGPIPPRVPLEVRTIATDKESDHTRYTVEIQVSGFSVLPAYVLVPHDADPSKPRPGLIVSHGHAQHGIDSMCGLAGMDHPEANDRAYALSAVRSGYITLVPSWWGWVGRDGHLAKVGPHRDKCNVIQMASSMYGINVIELHIQDAQAAVDALSVWPGVDPNRIGCAGNSYGGRTAMWMTICDGRIAATVSSGAMNVFRERSLKLLSCAIQCPHGLRRFGDVGELYCLIAPRPLQVQAGEMDDLITASDRDGIVASLTDAYAQYGQSENLDYQKNEFGHMLVWSLAEPFLAKHLGPVR